MVYGWELPWQARSKVFLKGNFFSGPPREAATVSLVSILILISIFDYVSLYNLMVEGNAKQTFYVTLFCGLTFLYNYLKCCYTDPGVILRPVNYDALYRKE